MTLCSGSYPKVGHLLTHSQLLRLNPQLSPEPGRFQVRDQGDELAERPREGRPATVAPSVFDRAIPKLGDCLKRDRGQFPLEVPGG